MPNFGPKMLAADARLPIDFNFLQEQQGLLGHWRKRASAAIKFEASRLPLEKGLYRMKSPLYAKADLITALMFDGGRSFLGKIYPDSKILSASRFDSGVCSDALKDVSCVEVSPEAICTIAPLFLAFFCGPNVAAHTCLPFSAHSSLGIICRGSPAWIIARPPARCLRNFSALRLQYRCLGRSEWQNAAEAGLDDRSIQHCLSSDDGEENPRRELRIIRHYSCRQHTSH